MLQEVEGWVNEGKWILLFDGDLVHVMKVFANLSLESFFPTEKKPPQAEDEWEWDKQQGLYWSIFAWLFWA